MSCWQEQEDVFWLCLLESISVRWVYVCVCGRVNMRGCVCQYLLNDAMFLSESEKSKVDSQGTEWGIKVGMTLMSHRWKGALNYWNIYGSPLVEPNKKFLGLKIPGGASGQNIFFEHWFLFLWKQKQILKCWEFTVNPSIYVIAYPIVGGGGWSQSQLGLEAGYTEYKPVCALHPVNYLSDTNINSCTHLQLWTI